MRVYLVQTYDYESTTNQGCFRNSIDAVRHKMFIQQLVDSVEQAAKGRFWTNASYKLMTLFQNEHSVNLTCANGVHIVILEVQ